MVRLPSSVLFVSVSAIAIACAPAPRDSDEAEIASELRLPKAAEIVGDLAFGQTVTVSYSETPQYRAFKLQGRQGDAVDLWVRSTTGDARVWLLRESGRTLAKNDDATASTMDAHVVVELPRTETYWVVIRDADFESNDFEVSLAGGGGPGSAVPASRIGTSFSADASCGFLIEWATFQSRTSTCPDFGYGWNEDANRLSFSIEGTAAAPVLVAKPFQKEKVVATWGEKRTVGWPETRIALDPETGKGQLTNRSNYDSRPGPSSYCYGVAKGTTSFVGSVTGDKLTFEMFENMQTNTCCSAQQRRATCSLTMP